MREIINKVNSITDFSTIKTISKEEAIEKGLYNDLGEEMDDLYIAEIKKNMLNPEAIKEVSEDLKIVYTPLHGTGNKLASRILKEIGFNPKFLIDALKVIDDEEIEMYMVNPKAPCFIKDANQSYLYLILPVNFNAVR